MKLLSRGLILVSLAVATGACSEPGNGACEGEMNGLYFRLSLYNFTEDTHSVEINGRPVGELGAYKGVDGAMQTVPATIELGEFPVCDGWVLNAIGTDNNALQEAFCSRAAFLSCGGQPDFCSEGFAICVEIDENGACITADGNPANFFPPPPSAICPCGLGPGEAWEYCR